MIEHAINTSNGGIMEVSITPLKTIRFLGIECMGFSVKEAKKFIRILLPNSSVSYEERK